MKKTLVFIFTIIQFVATAQKIEKKVEVPLSKFSGTINAPEFAGLGINEAGNICLLSWHSLIGKVKSVPLSSGTPFVTEFKFDNDLNLLNSEGELLGADIKKQADIFAPSEKTVAQTTKQFNIGRHYTAYTDSKPYFNIFKERIIKVNLASTYKGVGLDLSTFKSYPEFSVRYLVAQENNGTLRISDLVIDELQKEQNLTKLTKVVPAKNEPIRLENGYFQAIGLGSDEADKFAILKNFHFITFDRKGNIINKQATKYEYIREVSTVLPIHDLNGKVVGSIVFLAGAGGKKALKDPVDNNFNLVAIDAEGEVIMKYDFKQGEGSIRALIPMLAVLNDGKINILNLNQQKMFSPQFETLQFDSNGTVTKISSVPSKVFEKSIDFGNVGNGESVGQHNFFNTVELGNFVDGKGNICIISQRKVNKPGANGTEAHYGDIFVIRIDPTFQKYQQYVAEKTLSNQKVVFNVLSRDSKKTNILLSHPESMDRILTFTDTEISHKKITPDGFIYPQFGFNYHFVVDQSKNLLYLSYLNPMNPLSNTLFKVSLN